MNAEGKCPNINCEWQYNIHEALKKNIETHKTEVLSKELICPACKNKISAKFSICQHCGLIVMGSKTFRKTYLFTAVCIVLIILSLILKHMVK
jgi:hypothetical protein